MAIQKKNYHIVLYAILAIAFLILHYALAFVDWPAIADYIPTIKRLSISLVIIFIIFLLGKIVEKIIDKREETEGIRYNLIRIVHLLMVISIGIVIISFLFQNLYGMAVSFGLISLVLGFALQAPITSFIAWLYIVFRQPYKKGDRIQLEGIRGDVIQINYIDTVILECSGDYLGNDHQSGRIIHFPNSLILKDQVISYSGPLKPFIWNETPLQIAYTSDLKFVEQCLLKAAEEDFYDRFPDLKGKSNKKWQHQVYFRSNKYAWMEAVISYPVEPFDTTGRRNRILHRAMPLLNDAPDKVQFPEGVKR